MQPKTKKVGLEPRWGLGAGLNALLCGLAFVPHASQAQTASATSASPGAEVVVSASREPQMLKDAMPATSVINEARIRASQAQDLPTLLRREAGLEVVQNGGVGALASVFMRGSSSTHTVILLDGVRIDSLTTGTAPLQNIQLPQIERIEIVRGNVSALYGAQAMGGVIQIFTKKGNGGFTPEASLTFGSRDTVAGDAGFRGAIENRFGKTNYSFSVSHFKTSGFSAIDTGLAPAVANAVNPDPDGYRNMAVSGQLAHRFNQQVEAGLRVYRNESYLNYDNAFGARRDTHYADGFSESSSAYVRAQVLPRWMSTLTYARGRDYSKQYTNAVPSAPISSVNTQWTWANSIRVADGHTVQATLESQNIDLDSMTNYTRRGRNITSSVLGYNGRLGPIDAQLNWREDRFSDFGRKSTYYAGLAWNITDEWRVGVTQSTAFSAPNFNQLFFPGFGNPNLRPESARSNEASVQWARDAQLVRLTWFRTQYTDLISAAALNVNRAKVEGYELAYNGQVLGFDVRASATVQDPWDQIANVQLQRRAKRMAALGVGRNFGRFSFAVDWRSSSERRDFLITNSAVVSPLNAYQVFDLTARYAISKDWSLGLRVENALNQKYQLANSYNSAPLGTFVTLAWRPESK